MKIEDYNLTTSHIQKISYIPNDGGKWIDSYYVVVNPKPP